MPSFDAILIGGGTNAMAAAARLAGAGQKLLLLEAGGRLGGGAVTCEFAPGYRVSALAHLVNLLDPRVAKGMDLEAHGLTWATRDMATTALGPEGRHLLLTGAVGTDIGGDLATADRAAWGLLRARLMGFAGALAPFRAMTPPRIKGKGNEYLRLAGIGLGLRRLGREEFRAFLRLILINVADVLEDDLTDDRLMGTMAFDTVLGGWLGPRSPNSLFLLLNRLSGGGHLMLPKGGMGSVADAMAAALKSAGVETRCGTRVARVLVEGDRATGVELAGGEVIRAALIISALHPATTFLTLVGPAHLDTGFLRQTRALKSRGGTAKLHLALSGMPDFRGADPKTRLVIAPSVRAVEDAFNAVKYGEVPERPVLEVVIASAFEAGFAPTGHHVLSANVQFAPHAPKAGLQAARAQMLANTLAVLEDAAPGIGKLIVHAEMLMPEDIEARHGMVGGNWHQGELSVEQALFLRPFAGAARYATPLPGLWLAGAGTHPGGGISGAAGWNAAGAILKGGAA